MFEWRNLYRGFVIGATDIVPGVSGGTVAVILGIYDRLIAAISGIFSKDWRSHLSFLLPLLLGMVVSLFSLSRLISWLLDNLKQPTMFFFLGLIIGVVPFLLKEVNYKMSFRPKHYMVLIGAAILIALTDFINPGHEEIVEVLSLESTIRLFFSGWLGSMAMLLPGISGSLVLLLVGAYDTAINALKSFNIPIILTIGSGVGVGFIVSSKLIKFLLEKFHTMVYTVIIGLVIGSTLVIFPGFSQDPILLSLSCLSFVLGIGTAVSVGRRG